MTFGVTVPPVFVVMIQEIVLLLFLPLFSSDFGNWNSENKHHNEYLVIV